MLRKTAGRRVSKYADAAGDILGAIADPARPIIRGRVAVVVAHPDDETLGCGALLPRLADPVLIHVTDGAPAGGEDARRHGFAAPADYAAARARELRAVAALAGMPADRLVGLGVPDQGAAARLTEIARRLEPLLRGAEIVLTHAYEGGHPDHDATAFAVHAAVAMAEGRAQTPGASLEAPLRSAPQSLTENSLERHPEEPARRRSRGRASRRTHNGSACLETRPAAAPQHDEVETTLFRPGSQDEEVGLPGPGSCRGRPSGHAEEPRRGVSKHAQGPLVLEFPLYRLGPGDAWLRQSFHDPADAALLRLTPAERDLKRRMIAAHRTQHATLEGFGAADEWFRPAPAHDFTALPNGGALLYERHGWGLTGQRWRELAAAALAELGLAR